MVVVVRILVREAHETKEEDISRSKLLIGKSSSFIYSSDPKAP
jgi:hypothetical protein